MTVFEILALAGAIAVVPIIAYLALAAKLKESALIAAALSAGFAAFTAVTIWADGVMPVITNHTTNLWGVQVWYDLLMSVGIALLFVVPRARQMGMNVPLWVLFVGSTASIGLMAMVARLFWLEQSTAEDRTEKATSN
ncbi:hypothetical protein [Pontixanthobacter sp. CEM42]|uniref:hypothetical protein n=1 Tax=Pontixanthobacter sp. CEM42 TaxID=2792077 RepID=UPI001ADFC9A7|nr:hypothetical protein [Pontixanthobacter sp. CEM42]